MFFHRCPAQPRFLPCRGKCEWCTAHRSNPSRHGQPRPQHQLPPTASPATERSGEQQSLALDWHRVLLGPGHGAHPLSCKVTAQRGDHRATEHPLAQPTSVSALSFSPLCPVPAGPAQGDRGQLDPLLQGPRGQRCSSCPVEHPLVVLLPAAGGTQQGEFGCPKYPVSNEGQASSLGTASGSRNKIK